MANVIGPLFSVKATGSVAKTLCYKKGLKSTVCRIYAKPTGLPSPDQIAVRVFTGERMNHWPLISSVHQASWFLLALEQNIEPINAYLKFNWERKKQGLPTTDFYPPLPPVPAPDYIATPGSPSPNPDLTGNYYLLGTYDGQNCYKRTIPSESWIFFFATTWFIAVAKSQNPTNNYFYHASSIVGIYSSGPGYSGKVLVATP